MVHYQHPNRKWCTISIPTENGALSVPPQEMVLYQYHHREWCATSTTIENGATEKWCTSGTKTKWALPSHRMVHYRHTDRIVQYQYREWFTTVTHNGTLSPNRWVHYRHTTELCSIATENGALPSQNHEWHISATQHGALAPHRRVH